MKLLDENLHGCLFDFDGTVVLSEHVHLRAYQEVAESLGQSLPDGFSSAMVGVADMSLAVQLAESWGMGASADELLRKKRKHYLARIADECELVPGVERVLRRLKHEGIPVALATSSSVEEVVPILASLKLKECFHAIHTVESVERPKPDPEIYFKAAKSLDLRPEKCLVFEDSPVGAASARSAGGRIVTLSTSFSSQDLGECWFNVRDFNHERIVNLIG